MLMFVDVDDDWQMQPVLLNRQQKQPQRQQQLQRVVYDLVALVDRMLDRMRKRDS
jgi:hypothetical protein